MKRFKILLITLILVFLMLPVSAMPFSAEESPVWDGKIAEVFAGGTGTAEDPYIIQTAQQLAFFSKSVSIGTSLYEGEYVKLANDIVLNDTSGWENWSTTAPAYRWTPIGNDQFNFCGTFDGSGYTVSGVFINTTSDYRGLFGYVNKKGTVMNVGVMKSFIKGGAEVGGVAGCAFSCTVSNCYYTGTVSGIRAVGGVVGYLNAATVSDCYNTGAVTGTAAEGNKDGIGGVVGYALSATAKPAVIRNCYNTGAVTGTGIQCGGVAGSAVTCIISNCSNTGTVSGLDRVGGVAGYMHTCTVGNCYNIGTVSGTSNYVGGVAGQAIGCAVDNCYNTGMVSGDQNVGGVAGDAASYGNVSCTIHNCYNIGTVSGNKKVGGVTGWVLGIRGWFSPGTVSSCYYLKGTALGGINSADVSDQAVALTDTQLKLQDTYTDWDLIETWEFGGSELGYDYPTLIGVEHREIGRTAAVVISDEKAAGSFNLYILIVFAAVLAVTAIGYIIYAKKKTIEK